MYFNTQRLKSIFCHIMRPYKCLSNHQLTNKFFISAFVNPKFKRAVLGCAKPQSGCSIVRLSKALQFLCFVRKYNLYQVLVPRRGGPHHPQLLLHHQDDLQAPLRDHLVGVSGWNFRFHPEPSGQGGNTIGNSGEIPVEIVSITCPGIVPGWINIYFGQRLLQIQRIFFCSFKFVANQ